MADGHTAIALVHLVIHAGVSGHCAVLQVVVAKAKVAGLTVATVGRPETTSMVTSPVGRVASTTVSLSVRPAPGAPLTTVPLDSLMVTAAVSLSATVAVTWRIAMVL